MVESVLFVLTGSPVSIVAIAATTVVTWVWLTEYFMVRWYPDWLAVWDSTAYLWASLGFTALMAIGVKLRVWFLSRKLTPLIPIPGTRPRIIRLVPERHAHTVEALLLMIDQIVVSKEMRWVRTFLLWRRARLAIHLPRVILAKPWWWTWKAFVLTWPRLLWYPLLLLLLHQLPLSPRYESFAAWATGYRVRVFSITAEGADIAPPPRAGRAAGRWVSERLVHDGVAWRRVNTSLLTQGTLTFATTRFPHLSHRLLAMCGGENPGCQVAANGDLPFQPKIELTVRDGMSQLHFYVVNPELRMNMSLSLLRADRGFVDEAWIEPTAKATGDLP
jgi:hypothetical protein